MQNVMTLGFIIVGIYTFVLVSVVTYDVLTGRIKRLYGLAHRQQAAQPSSADE